MVILVDTASIFKAIRKGIMDDQRKNCGFVVPRKVGGVTAVCKSAFAAEAADSRRFVAG